MCMEREEKIRINRAALWKWTNQNYMRAVHIIIITMRADWEYTFYLLSLCKYTLSSFSSCCTSHRCVQFAGRMSVGCCSLAFCATHTHALLWYVFASSLKCRLLSLYIHLFCMLKLCSAFPLSLSLSLSPFFFCYSHARLLSKNRTLLPIHGAYTSIYT